MVKSVLKGLSLGETDKLADFSCLTLSLFDERKRGNTDLCF